MTKTECKDKILKYVKIQLNKLNLEQLNNLADKHTCKKKKKTT